MHLALLRERRHIACYISTSSVTTKGAFVLGNGILPGNGPEQQIDPTGFSCCGSIKSQLIVELSTFSEKQCDPSYAVPQPWSINDSQTQGETGVSPIPSGGWERVFPRQLLKLSTICSSPSPWDKWVSGELYSETRFLKLLFAHQYFEVNCLSKAHARIPSLRRNQPLPTHTLKKSKGW